VVRGALDVRTSRRAAALVELTGTMIGGGEQTEIDDRQRVPVEVDTQQSGAVPENRGVAVHDDVVAEAVVCMSPQHDLGTDARGIAHRDGQRRAHERTVSPQSSAKSPTSASAPPKLPAL